MNLEGNGRSVIDVLCWYLHGVNDGKKGKSSVSIASVLAESRSSQLRGLPLSQPALCMRVRVGDESRGFCLLQSFLAQADTDAGGTSVCLVVPRRN